MIWSATQIIILFGYVIALAGHQALWVSLATMPHHRRHMPLGEQEPPGWLAPLARAVLVLALAALGLATLLDGGNDAP